MVSLPDEIVNKINLYNSHPCADIIKQSFAPILLTQTEMNNLKCQLEEDKTYHIWTRNKSGLNSITTFYEKTSFDKKYLIKN